MAIYAALSDLELSIRLTSGDRAAFTEIFSRYNKLLYSHAYNKLRETEEAKDIVHDVFYSLWANRERSAPNSNLTGYLFAAVRNKIADLLSHRQVKDKYIVSLQQHIDQAPEYAADQTIREKQLRDIIEEEIAALPPRMQEIFRLSRFEQLSHKEIAEKLNIQESTSKDQVKKALRILRIKLGLIVFLLFYFKLL